MDGATVARLVRAAAAGDENAWDALVREFGPMIWAVARAHRLGEADAADVSQATWLQLVEHLGDLNNAASVGAWLATTARHQCLRVLRRAERVRPCGDDLPEPPSTEPGHDRELVIAERDRALWQAVERLSAGDRALLRMLMAEPRPSYDEISAALNMPIGSIGPTRSRALARLRRELEASQDLELMAA
jgi:RNA polymerase sigma factor (sigma-70 family)